MVDDLTDEALDGLLARPDQIQTKAFVRQGPCCIPEAPADAVLRVAHAPVRIGQALHQDVGWVHADTDLAALIVIPGTDFGVPLHPRVVVPTRRETAHAHCPRLDVRVVGREQDLARNQGQHAPEGWNGAAKAAHQIVVASLSRATRQYIDVADYATFTLVTTKQRGLVDAESGQAVPAGQRRTVGITPRSAVAHLDLLHGIDRPLA